MSGDANEVVRQIRDAVLGTSDPVIQNVAEQDPSELSGSGSTNIFTEDGIFNVVDNGDGTRSYRQTAWLTASATSGAEIDDPVDPLTGPVEYNLPDWATDKDIEIFEEYVAGSNRAIAAGALSPTGRVASTQGGSNSVRKQAEKAAKKEKARARAANKPYSGVAGHVPDAAWLGQGEPPEWLDMPMRVNSSLAGRINAYPVGYKPTEFKLNRRGR